MKEGRDNEEYQYRAFKVYYTDTKTIMFLSEIKECPECHSRIFDTDKEHNINCRTCGLVLTGIYPYVAGEKIHYPYDRII